ncbi:RNA polymerase subunit sigma-70 [Xenorhabdus bovienii]|uniref:RNA polymerase subunit sigma-70 n=1 Tax=Xenorhabdus bovienii TaxID=40576 RepID=UPI0023B22757|nr:RNA polymerase subunit sigma-70 [Xenorhabdus bovienii]MDE9571058.1 RNA polymerase subunit sigma-70 [Xenorhabdus bovienii]
MSTMSISKYAKHVGVNRKTITRWIGENKYIVIDGNKVNVEASDQNLKQYRDSQDLRTQNAKKNPGTLDAGSLETRAKAVYDELLSGEVDVRPIEESRAIKEHYLAELVKLEHSIKSGEVLPWRDIVNKVGEEYAWMRTRLTAIAPEHGPRLRALATTSTDTEFVAALQEIIHEAMEELSLDNSTHRAEGG